MLRYSENLENSYVRSEEFLDRLREWQATWSLHVDPGMAYILVSAKVMTQLPVPYIPHPYLHPGPCPEREGKMNQIPLILQYLSRHVRSES
ncbi:hypothetical protein BaRGS_00034493 [Batillaria attramentaria]|uniref:Uncharacterized protein n=1 Tax=Batillaria attramentaria TaxID=370345 RepID=A0ABD0JHK8_9CAEN